MKFIRFILIFAVLFFSYFAYKNFVSEDLMNTNQQNNEKVTVIFANFSSKDLLGRWHGEAAPFLRNLEKTQEVSGNIPMCNSGYEGYLSGQKVLVATSGMAKVKATACIMDILNKYEGNVKEVILVGIAGITPMKGGLQDEAGGLRDGEPAMIGDVCINSVAFDFDLQHYSSDQPNTTLPEPYFWPQRSEFPAAYVEGDTKLAKELYSASLEVEWPELTSNIESINTMYHDFSRNPKAWKLTECLESTDDLFWHDIRADRQARNLGVSYINKTHNTTLTSDDILVVSSMEAVPVGIVVTWWNNSNGTDIPFAYVRGASNFDHAWLNSDGIPAIDGRSSIEKLMESGGGEYAIETEAMPILKMLELRSNK